MNIFEFYMVELAVIDEGLKGIAECWLISYLGF
jgi:hypothetical protein